MLHTRFQHRIFTRDSRVQKMCHQIHSGYSVNSLPIFKILSLAYLPLNLHKRGYYQSNYAEYASLHYHVKQHVRIHVTSFGTFVRIGVYRGFCPLNSASKNSLLLSIRTPSLCPSASTDILHRTSKLLETAQRCTKTPAAWKYMMYE